MALFYPNGTGNIANLLTLNILHHEQNYFAIFRSKHANIKPADRGLFFESTG